MKQRNIVDQDMQLFVLASPCLTTDDFTGYYEVTPDHFHHFIWACLADFLQLKKHFPGFRLVPEPVLEHLTGSRFLSRFCGDTHDLIGLQVLSGKLEC